MHLAGNLSDLLISLWCGMIDYATTDNVIMWDWAVLCDVEAWSAHRELVAQAGPFLPGSFDCKPHNIAEKLNTSYKTWKFQLYIFDCIHFIHPCIYQTNYLVAETICKDPPICYTQWTMEHTIRNLGQEIHQPSCPYTNLSQEGVQCCQVNTLLSAIPELNEPSKGLLIGAIDLGDGFALLQNVTDMHSVWLEIARSVWRETLKPSDQTYTSHNVKIKYHGEVQFSEVLYFTRLLVEAGPDEDHDWCWHDVALIQIIKQILSVIAMIPHKPILPSGVMDEEGQFFMLEKPGLDLSSVGITNVPPDDEDNVPDIE
ncbi:hypothetical protein BDR06DRAFT_984131 [Suillus hirtellus]|nr:hypothetical protein BDR06DRAFT_984131 [Suillus hirtellus]